MKKIQIKRKQFGNGQRLLHQENILENSLLIPSPVEYEDIDNAFCLFFDKMVDLIDDNGKKVPTFKVLSNQRFTEFSQTWEHTDEDGNLLTDFKLINRNINPSWGSIHNGMSNIPGNNRFTVKIRDIIDDTGVECYEITSMSQPLSVDFEYTLTYISDKIEKINKFNTQILNLFQSKQCYIYPKGHPMPMLLDAINDESNYNIEDRKFYSQPITIKVLGYIIPKDDIKVDIKPKRKHVKTNLDKHLKAYVDMDIDDDNNNFCLNVKFPIGVNNVTFKLEDKVKVYLKTKNNVNSIWINDEPLGYNDNLIFLPNEEINIKITQYHSKKESELFFNGNFFENC